VQGTQVGGDWYDIIELGAGRTALVVGDVMGRGVRAAAGMGQLRSAVRAFSKLDLPPAEMLEYLDGLVQDMGGDQIVTCFYAIFDSTDQTLRYANAGHLPALLVSPGERPVRLSAAGPPLGAGYFGMRTESVRLVLGATVVLYTDGLVERRSRDIDVGIDAVVERLERHADAAVEGLPELLVDDLLPEGPDDDIAILVARVDSEPFEAAVSHRLVGGDKAVAEARRMVSSHLREWEVGVDVSDEVVLMASELVTNAFMHGRAPIDLRLRRTGSEIVFEVQDRAVYRPRRRRAADDDEHGRGLHIVSVLVAGCTSSPCLPTGGGAAPPAAASPSGSPSRSPTTDPSSRPWMSGYGRRGATNRGSLGSSDASHFLARVAEARQSHASCTSSTTSSRVSSPIREPRSSTEGWPSKCGVEKNGVVGSSTSAAFSPSSATQNTITSSYRSPVSGSNASGLRLRKKTNDLEPTW
jgi:anti-sigma regulatory factor (Ser/Thr protein kinase)